MHFRIFVDTLTIYAWQALQALLALVSDGDQKGLQ